MSNVFVNASFDNFSEKTIEIECNDEIKSFGIIINGEVFYEVQKPAGEPIRSAELRLIIK